MRQTQIRIPRPRRAVVLDEWRAALAKVNADPALSDAAHAALLVAMDECCAEQWAMRAE